MLQCTWLEGAIPPRTVGATVSELLTTRELQNLLKVDRITIYRMLEQGRLPGFKVGGQWRFSRREIEEWLEAQRDALTLMDEFPAASASVPLPLHCVRNVQDVFAEALDVGAVTTDLNGTPLTRISHPCAFCEAVLSSSTGRNRCMEVWKGAGASDAHAPAPKQCHAGLSCMSMLVRVGGNPVAVFSACQFALAGSDEGAATAEHVRRLARDLGLDEETLVTLRERVPVLADASVARLSRLVQRVSVTLSEIGDERLSLLSRLERIAEMTRV